MKHHYLYLILAILPLTGFSQFSADDQNYQKYEGLFNYQYDPATDKIYLEVKELEKEFLYVYSLSSGIGSNDIGLDRGQLGEEQVVYFKKAGNKLLLIQPNQKFRALTDNKLEKKSVQQAFAKSVLFGTEILSDRNGVYTIDLSALLMRDAHGVVQRLKRTKQGSYSLDKEKSAMNLERTRAFPKNVEFDVLLTFKGTAEGEYIKSVTPNPDLVTVTQHHSFIALPDDNYKKRVFNPGCGAYPFAYYDYATPVQEPILKRYIARHRLEKKDPEAPVSEAVEPIVYYLDNGTPEPVRSALLEGGQWWNQAFEAIGYKDAFRVEILPDEADPLDVRYNVIQWVHRSTRGWSYGSSIKDPRTGEIIKGHVSLGSLRIRQDFMIAQALSNKPFAEGDDKTKQILDMALARIRQLSAHEIGHTLGYAHNFSSSTNNRASVMDYPHPKIRFNKGEIDLSDAYDTGIGEWDKVAIAYSYSHFPEGTNEEEALREILKNAQQKGLRYITDQDARPQGSSHGLAHLWDNGTDPVVEFQEVMAVRKKAIENFSVDNIRSYEPYTVLEDVFVPLYFFHRYQTEAMVKMLGGMDYNYALRGDGQFTAKVLPRSVQEGALKSLLSTLDAGDMAIPKDKIGLFPPRAFGYPRDRESFKSRSGVAFDPFAATETAADFSLSLLLHPQRATRLVQQNYVDPAQLGLAEVLEAMVSGTIGSKSSDPYLQGVQEAINYRVLIHLFHLASSKEANPMVRAVTHSQLRDLRDDLNSGKRDVHDDEMLRMIADYFREPAKFKPTTAPKIPDGSPIGMACGSN